ncbi:C2H2-type zinc finger transcription factor [Mucor lusitanicus]|uniref:C2H2-type zinc finger transcription factor n=2 Tax=Mucor circinelloides f. lusitanicus TaxID=29924 RepID=A0A168HL00_MUCCL|nr:C2H2-type zinc finger transcription factor [Mucor lusitanicus CBS 277.49]
MKLRARKKSFLSNIKQEDCKPTLSNAQLSTTEVAKYSTIDLPIKQEDSKDHKVSLEQHDKFGSKGYYYRCDICNKGLPNLKSVLEHRKSNHISSLYNSTTMAKNLDKEPDLYNPDFYCKSCEKGYSDRHTYRNHLRAVHFMVLKRLQIRMTQKINVTPDPNDPNLHCKACNFTYKCKSYYMKHCRYTHGLNPPEFANQTSSSSSSSLTDSYCQTCDKRLSSIQSYRRHLFLVHKVNIRQIQRKQKDVLPNVNDPNFYCHSCEKKMASKHSFSQHLRWVHSIFKSAPPQSKLKPDIDDPNNYCRACQKTYSSKGVYRAHLRLVHQMILPLLRVDVNHKQLPDPYSRDNYCSVCKKKYVQAGYYRQHCKNAHLMVLDHHSIVNPNAEINVNDPDFYCSQCERSLSSEMNFKRHLERVHSIVN